MAPRRNPLAGRLHFWGDRALYLGPDVSASVHSHYALQVCIGLSGPVRLRTGPGARWGAYWGAIIPSNLPHETDVPVALLATFWLEPTTPNRRLIAATAKGERIVSIEQRRLDQLVPKLRACWRERYDSEQAARLLDEVVRILAGEDQPAAIDARVARACELMAAAPHRRAPLDEIATRVSLSASRVSHLLRSELGLPARRYQLWLRLRDAIGELEKGRSVTDAALAAGFSDAAHLSRTFRRMLGFTPSTLRRVSRFVQATAGPPD